MMGGVIDWPTLVGVLGGGLSAYVAIKSDLSALHAKVENASKAAELAHKRIDRHINGGHHEKATAKA